jgi:hypothetical protein
MHDRNAAKGLADLAAETVIEVRAVHVCFGRASS